MTLLESRIQKAKKTLCFKAKEYAQESNRFHNFMQTAKMWNETPEESLIGFIKKHLTSMWDIIDNKFVPTEEQFEEKFGNVFNYTVLLMGMAAYEPDMENILNQIQKQLSKPGVGLKDKYVDRRTGKTIPQTEKNVYAVMVDHFINFKEKKSLNFNVFEHDFFNIFMALMFLEEKCRVKIKEES